MKITAYELRDFKRIESARVEPGDRGVILIGGKNGQGKSSLLDGLTAAFGGKRQTDPQPVRDGADHASIEVELDGGKLIIRRRISADGRQQLELYDESGKRRSPQRILDELVGARFLDPLAFIRLGPKEQRDALIGCVRWPEGFHYGRWQAAYDAAYERRRDLRRRAKELAAAAREAEAQRPGEVPEAPDVGELVARLDELQVEARRREDLRRAAIEATEREQKLRAEVTRQQEIVARAQEQLEKLERDLDEQIGASRRAHEESDDARSEDVEAEMAAIKERISDADHAGAEHRAAIARAEAADRATLAADAAAQKAADADAKIEELQIEMGEVWNAAEVPIPEIEWDDRQVLLDDVPFQQASNAEQLRAALAIAMAMSPSIQDIWVKDGSLLDEGSLELVREIATEHGYRVWLERVGERDADAIIIREGTLAATDDEAA